MKLIIQIPCLNEAETLEIALNDLPTHIDGIDEIEYLIINDGSSDNTVEVAKRWGVQHVVSFPQNKGLAKGFMAGFDACLRLGADIIVNTDADNQYRGDDIEKLVRPILEGRAEVVIGARPIDETEHFSFVKKKLQHLGSFVVRKASKTDIPDAPSGFRAYSREAALHTNVINNYTYTLETIVQAGRNRMSITSVPIRTNAELRSSRLFSSMAGYVKKSMLTIIRAYMMYRPLVFFSLLGAVPFIAGLAIAIRFLSYYLAGNGMGHTQSLILAATFMLIGFMTFIIGFLADVIAANRKLLEDIQYRVRRMELPDVDRSREDEILTGAAKKPSADPSDTAGKTGTARGTSADTAGKTGTAPETSADIAGKTGTAPETSADTAGKTGTARETSAVSSGKSEASAGKPEPARSKAALGKKGKAGGKNTSKRRK